MLINPYRSPASGGILLVWLCRSAKALEIAGTLPLVAPPCDMADLMILPAVSFPKLVQCSLPSEEAFFILAKAAWYKLSFANKVIAVAASFIFSHGSGSCEKVMLPK